MKSRKVICQIVQRIRLQLVIRMFVELLHRQEMSLEARINVHILIEPVPFVIGRQFRDVGSRHGQGLQTKLLGPFLTTEFRPEYILPTDIGQKAADEADGLEVPSGKEGKDMIQHCRISSRSECVESGPRSIGSCEAKSTGLR